MQAPPPHPRESQRLEDLHDYGILDTDAERVFDEIAALAAAICGTRYAAITLVDRDRQWFKAHYGRPFVQTTREVSVCGHAILSSDYFEVQDTHEDERFVNNPLLQEEPEIRFYGGSQLNSGRGNAIGMLCVLDSQPQQLSQLQRIALRHLADVTMAVIEAGRKSRLFSWFGALVDSMTDEMYVIEPDTLEYLHANRSAVANTGIALEDLRRSTPMALLSDPDRARFEGYVVRLRLGEPRVVFEGWRVRADGTRYPVEVRWQLLETNGRSVVLSHVHDITQRREVERMKNEFISVVNHELRTPLTSIHGSVKLLQQGAAGALPPAAARLLDLASENTDRLRRIVDDILDLEKIASGRMQLQLEPLHVATVLADVARSYEPAAVQAGVTLKVQADDASHIRADAQRTHQVLANLVSNALKFAPKGSEVRLRGLASPRDGFARLEVHDAGTGIPDEFRKRIFQRFAQADMGDSRAKNGSGLGLSIALEMTQLMDGNLDFQSEPGHTCFYIDLPEAR